MKSDKPEPGSDPIFNDGTDRFPRPYSSRYSLCEWACSSGEASAPFWKETNGLNSPWVHCAPFRHSPPSCWSCTWSLPQGLWWTRKTGHPGR